MYLYAVVTLDIIKHRYQHWESEVDAMLSGIIWKEGKQREGEFLLCLIVEAQTSMAFPQK